MIWTKRQLIEKAMTVSALASYTYDLTPAQYQSSLTSLDGMMGVWQARTIFLNWPQATTQGDADLDTTVTLPDEAEQPIYLNLAILIAPEFGKTISNDTQKMARSSYSTLLGTFTKPVERSFPDTLPVGAGNKPWRDTENPYFPTPVASTSDVPT